MKERKQPGETNSALYRRLGYLGKLANIKEVSGNDLLMMQFTALCDDEALMRDIFKIKDLSWNSLQEAVNTHEAAPRMDTVTLTRDKLFNLSVSNTRSSSSSSPLPERTPSNSSGPNPFTKVSHSSDKKGQEWIQERNKEKSKLVDGVRNDSFRKKSGQEERTPRSRSRDHVTCHRCFCQGHPSALLLPQSRGLPPRGHQGTETEGPADLPGTEIGRRQGTERGEPQRAVKIVLGALWWW